MHRKDILIRIGPLMLCKLSYSQFYFERRRIKMKCKYVSRGGLIYKSANSSVTDYCFDSNIPKKISKLLSLTLHIEHFEVRHPCCVLSNLKQGRYLVKTQLKFIS